MTLYNEKQLRQEFAKIAQSSDSTAIKYLKKEDWDLSRALNSYFNKYPNKRSQNSNYGSYNDLISIFDKYKDPEEDSILIDGIERYCQDLEIEPTDISMLVLAYHLGAEQMGEFKKQNFIRGWEKLGCYEFKQQKERVHNFKDQLEDPVLFKLIYKFAFEFGKNPGQRTLDNEIAVGLWQLLLHDKFESLDLWIDFIQNEFKRNISKDVWNTFLDFSKQISPQFDNHDSTGAWPVLFDEFVEYAQKKIAN